MGGKGEAAAVAVYAEKSQLVFACLSVFVFNY